MENTKLNCKYCGAPLVVLNGETLVKCEYCGMTTVVEAPQGVAPLVEYGFMILENGRFEDADNAFENALKGAPRNSDAHLGKLMTEYKIKTRDEMKNYICIFEGGENYKNLLKYGSKEWKDIILNNNVAALKQKRDGYADNLAGLKQKSAATERYRIATVNDIQKKLASYNLITLIAVAITAIIWGIFILAAIIIGGEINGFGLFLGWMGIMTFLPAAFLVVVRVTKNSWYGSQAKKIDDIRKAQSMDQNNNRNAECELEEKIKNLQDIIDKY